MTNYERIIAGLAPIISAVLVMLAHQNVISLAVATDLTTLLATIVASYHATVVSQNRKAKNNATTDGGNAGSQ